MLPSTHYPKSLSALLSLLSLSHFGGEVFWLDIEGKLLFLSFPAVQLHHVPAPSVVKGGRHSGPAVQVLPARASDDDPLAEERALGADFLVELVQELGCFGDSLYGRQHADPPGFLVILGNPLTTLIANAQKILRILRLEL